MRNGEDKTSSDEDSGSSASDSTSSNSQTDSAAISSDEEASSSSPEPSTKCLDGAKSGEESDGTPQLNQAAKAEFRARNILALKNDRSGVPRSWLPDGVVQLASRRADADARSHATLRSLNVSRKPLAQVLTVQGQESVLRAFKSPVPGASGPSQARFHA